MLHTREACASLRLQGECGPAAPVRTKMAQEHLLRSVGITATQSAEEKLHLCHTYVCMKMGHQPMISNTCSKLFLPQLSSEVRTRNFIIVNHATLHLEILLPRHPNIFWQFIPSPLHGYLFSRCMRLFWRHTARVFPHSLTQNPGCLPKQAAKSLIPSHPFTFLIPRRSRLFCTVICI